MELLNSNLKNIFLLILSETNDELIFDINQATHP